MKKQSRILLLILSLAILVGSVVGLSVSAEENGALGIEAINLSYGDRTQVLIAVSVDNAQRDNVEVTYTLNGETKTAFLHPTETYKPTETEEYPVFYTSGIAAKDMADAIKIEAHIKDSTYTPVYSETSVAEYLYHRLYNDNIINAADGTDDARRRTLYLNCLEYGASAQDVLVNIKNEDNGIAAETLVNKYLYAWSDDADVKVDGTSASGVYAPGTAITPTYTGAGKIYGWYLVSPEGSIVDKLAADASVTLTEHVKITPNLTGSAVADYENGLLYTDYVNSYLYVDGTLTNAKDVTDMDSQTHMKFYLADDPTGAVNKVLKAQKYGKASSQSYTVITPSNEDPTGNCYTVSMRAYIDTAYTNYSIFQITFRNSKGRALELNFKHNSTTGLVDLLSGGDYAYPKEAIASFKMDSWFNVRAEFYHSGSSATMSNTYLKVYVDTGDGEVLAYDGLGYYQNSLLGAELSQIAIQHYNSDKTSIVYFDDIYATQTDKAYEATVTE